MPLQQQVRIVGEGKHADGTIPIQHQAAETDGESTQMAPSLSHFPYSFQNQATETD